MTSSETLKSPEAAEPQDERVARRHRRVPRALAALLAATAVLGLAWTLVVPPFQAPDEPAHVAYVQSLAERGKLPGEEGRDFWSTEQRLGADAAKSERTAQLLYSRPEWSKAAHEGWLRRSERLSDTAREDGGGVNPASPNPPLYYLLETVPYRVASSGDLFARLTAMRLVSVLFLLITVGATWLLAGTVFGPRRELQFAAAAVPALMPMVTAVASSVSPDSLLYALWSLAFWLGARVLLKGARPVEVAGLLAVAGLAVVTKSTSYALLPPVALVLAISAWRVRGSRRTVARLVVVGLVAFAATAGTWYVVARINDRPAAAQLIEAERPPDFNEREFASYVWQYYLPRLPFMNDYPPFDRLPSVYEIFFKQGWGAFGWLEILYPERLYWVLGLLTLVVAAGALVALIKHRRSLSLPLLAFLALSVLGLIGGLHWNEYRLAESRGILVNQGRYLFPLIAVAGLAAAAAVTALPTRWRGPALGVFLGSLTALQLYAIGLVATRFYA
jgi:4-amino-4-deoxy-L-arabinose transferase-like glycosyltransferase